MTVKRTQYWPIKTFSTCADELGNQKAKAAFYNMFVPHTFELFHCSRAFLALAVTSYCERRVAVGGEW